jgi:hypothetical protein
MAATTIETAKSRRPRIWRPNHLADERRNPVRSSEFRPLYSLGWAGASAQLREEPVVVVVASDPEPDAGAVVLGGEGAVVKTDPGRPNSADPLEVKRWVARI